MAERKRLSDILSNSGKERLERTWSTVQAADDLKPLPSGDYRCRVLSGELFNAKKGTPGYKLTLEVIDGDYVGHRVWHDIWLTEAALSMAKRDLVKLGIDRPEHLERRLPEGIIVVAKVSLRRENDGTERNRIVRFEVVDVETPTPEPFAPIDDESAKTATTDADGYDWQTGEQRNGVPTP